RVGFARATRRAGRTVFGSAADVAAGADLAADREVAIRMAPLRRIPFDRAPIESGKPPGVRGGRSEIQDSSVSTSGAFPGDATNPAGSEAGILSMMVRRVSAVVP